MARTLSKSDFTIAQSCPAKLYYEELGYPTARARHEYLPRLADGAYLVGAIARLLYPEGQLVESGPTVVDAARATRQRLAAGDAVLFEPTLLVGAMLARPDILVQYGDEIDLIEVLARRWDGGAARERADAGRPTPLRTRRGEIAPEWREPLEAIAFQVHVLESLLPGITIHPYLLMPDRSKSTSIDAIHRLFRVRRPPAGAAGRERLQVEYLGDPERLRRDHFLTHVAVGGEVAQMLPGVRARAAEYARSLGPQLVKLPAPLSLRCRDCQFRATDDDRRDGFHECWGALGRTEPHLLDLYRVEAIGPAHDPLANRLIAAGRAGLLDLSEQDLVPLRDDADGEHRHRQLVQLRHTRVGTPWVSEELGPLLDELAYPLHFVHLETSQLAVPYHAGMRPGERVAFQWSCHTIPAPGARVEHAEWINTEDFFPNFEFAASLERQLGDAGTMLVWSAQERAALRDILRQMGEHGHEAPDLGAWMDMLKATDAPRLVELQTLTLRHYFHPLMRGGTSVRQVLDAVWHADPEVRALFPEYALFAESPYRALPALEIAGERVRVEDDRRSRYAYQAMMYGAEREDEIARTKFRRLLLQSGRLDTAAMVMVWDHWRRATAPAVVLPFRARSESLPSVTTEPPSPPVA